MQKVAVHYDKTSSYASSNVRSACYAGVDAGLGVDDVIVNIMRQYSVKADRRTVKAIMWKAYGL